MTLSPPRPLQKHEDSRGWVVEALRGDQLPAALRSKPFAQIHLSHARAGQAKANHYHARRHEWFFVVAGRALVALQPLDPITKQPTGPIEQWTLSADEPAVLDVPPFVVHAFRAVGGPCTIMAYATEVYDPKDTDTIPFVLLKPD